MQKDGQELFCQDCGRSEKIERFDHDVCVFQGNLSPERKVNGCRFFIPKVPGGLPIRSMPIKPLNLEKELKKEN